MEFIRIDRQMLLEEILIVRASLSFENEDAKERIDKLISLINNLPLDQNQAQFPKAKIRRL